MGWLLLRAAARGLCLVAFLLGGCGAVLLLVREPCADLVHTWAAGGTHAIASLPFRRALTGLCAVAVLLCSTWLAGTASMVALVAIAQAAVGREHPRLAAVLPASQVLAHGLCPALARRLVLASCGIALGSGLGAGLALTPAAADSWAGVDPQAATPHDATPTGWVDGLDVPDRTPGARTGPVPATVTRGDSLWSISADFLPPSAPNAEIDAAWREMHRANLDLIGPDPDVIFPGTTLQVPPPDTHERKEGQ